MTWVSIYVTPGMRAPVFLGGDRNKVSRSQLGAWPDVISHGFYITTSNTGHDAYFDSTLGRLVTDADLTNHASSVTLSSITSAGGTVMKRNFQAGIDMDISNVTFTACKFNGGVSGFDSPTHRPFTLNWCTIDTSGAAGDDGVQYQDFTAYRCQIGGCSDGCKTNGGVTLTECYIRCKGQDSGDHNDGTQSVGSYTGNTIQRCNVDCRPTNGIGNPNAALFAADASNGLQTWTDNWCAGGGYTLRCYEDSTYNVQGNWVLNSSWVFGAADRAVIPPGNLTWGTVRPNLIVDSNGATVSTLAAP